MQWGKVAVFRAILIFSILPESTLRLTDKSACKGILLRLSLLLFGSG
jgi:hypothetical protein